MSIEKISESYRISKKFKVRFTLTQFANAVASVDCEWFPEKPRSPLRGATLHRYQVVKGVFLTKVARELGASVASVDARADGSWSIQSFGGGQ